MTDAAVIADSAPAPVDGAPIEGGHISPQPLGSQIPPDAQAKSEPAKAPSVEDSIDRALAKSAEASKSPKVEAKADVKAPEAKEPKQDQPRENGKFASKDGVKAPATDSTVAVAAAKPVDQVKPAVAVTEPPSRFSEDAKAIWKDTPEPVRRESERAIRELTQGIEKHKAEYEPIRPFAEMAKQAGTTVEAALKEYTDLDKLLHTDKIKGLERIFERIGISPRDYAAHILNQTPDEVASQSDATIRELKQELATLKEQVGGVTQTFQHQREQSTLQEVTKFAQDNPRFEELSEDIVFFMKSGRAKDLTEAYSLAERLNPAAQAAVPVVQTASSAVPEIPTASEAHTLNGTKSITGAPSAGLTSPGKKRVALSLDDALNKAFGQAG